MIAGGSIASVVILGLAIALVVVFRKYQHSMNYPVHVVAPRFGPSVDYEEGYTTRPTIHPLRARDQDHQEPFSDYTTDIPEYLQTNSQDYYDEDGDYTDEVTVFRTLLAVT